MTFNTSCGCRECGEVSRRIRASRRAEAAIESLKRQEEEDLPEEDF